jgi:hypothetical protein
VFVIDDAHTMNDSAQNALLEEPRGAGFPLARDPGLVGGVGLRPTIRSRCQRLRFGPLPRAIVSELLQRERGLDRRPRSCRRRSPGGSLAEALSHDPGSELARATSSWRSSSASRRPTRSAHGGGRGARAVGGPVVAPRHAALAAARPGRRSCRGRAQALLNPDRADRLAALAAGRSASARSRSAARPRTRARRSRGFTAKLLTFDRLVNALAGD